MLTQCPQCQTHFDVTDEQLQRASGSVRCEHCNTVFVASPVEPAAKEAIPDLEPVSVDSIELEDPSAMLDSVDVQASDLDMPDMPASPDLDAPELTPIDELHVDDIELPEKNAVQQPDTPVTDVEDNQPTDAPGSQTPAIEEEPASVLSGNKVHVLDFNAQQAANADLLVKETDAAAPVEHILGKQEQDDSTEIRDETGSGYDPRQLYPELEASDTPRAEQPTGYILASIALIALFVVQSIYLLHDEIAEQTALRPFIQGYCEVFDCYIELPRDPDAIVLREREIRSHPGVTGALSVSAQIENTAVFKQAYPLLQLQFRDIAGHIVAGRDFQPREYLPKDVDVHDGIDPARPVNVALELSDPGNKAVSYLFIFK